MRKLHSAGPCFLDDICHKTAGQLLVESMADMYSENSRLSENPEMDRNAIREQLERILEDPLFLFSKRYPSFLRYVVAQTLEGKADGLKERTLGMEVFGRDPNYDTNLDNVVRSTAGEIRKRLAQYYQAPQHKDEIRIDLPLGSYVPRFHPPGEEPAPAMAPPVSSRRARLWTIAGVALIACMITALGWTVYQAPQTPLERFWEPVLRSQNSILLCTGTVQSLARQTAQMRSAEVSGAPVLPSDTRQHVTLVEADALIRFGSLLNLKDKPFRLRDDNSITLNDLKNAPVILVGAMNNQWTLRLVAPLRFHFQSDTATNTVWIADRQHPYRRDWIKDGAVLPEKITEDYAIISRFRNQITGQYAIISAGLYRFGTIAAAEFLTDPALLSELAAAAPRGWENQNVQAVIATKVMDGSAARPRVVATHFW
jgi:hypothetical protein